jgi:Bacterial domain of unknown function (DUF1798).
MLNKRADDQFTQITTKPDYQVDFQGKVKPFADLMQATVDVWKPMAEDWIVHRKPKYIHPEQIKATCENLQIVGVTAFQTDTRRRRFHETIEAVDYVLDTMLAQLAADRSDSPK